MLITSIRLRNFRSFEDSGDIVLGPITVFVGQNNAGKSTVLRGFGAIQQGAKLSPKDVRVGATAGSITLHATELPKEWQSHPNGQITVALNRPARDQFGLSITVSVPGTNLSVSQLPSVSPDHLIVPYLSGRKVPVFQEDVREQHALQITDTMAFLAARLSMVANPQHPRYEAYRSASQEILGFVVTPIPAPSGQQPGIYLPSGESLPIGQLGEGVPQVVALLVELALADGKLFLMEEPENDLHPAALKKLLALVLESAKRNQFVVSTHSNVVLRYLCSDPENHAYQITNPTGSLPVKASVTRIEPNSESRLEALRVLGYELSDFELWDGWLFLEEASAERIIRDYLIPWFVPELARVRTVSCNGSSKVEPSFEDFFRLVRFTHLEHTYRQSTWVRVDHDASGQAVVEALRSRFKDWAEDRFGTFTEAHFERYYPEQFSERVDQVLALKDRAAKRVAKKELLDEVLCWIRDNSDRAKTELQIRARPVIDDLRAMAASLD